MVGFDQSRKMGEHATSGATSNYRNTVVGMKRLVGLAFDDPIAGKEMAQLPQLTFKPMPSAGGGPDGIGVKVTLNNEESVVRIEAVLGMMIKHMGSIAAEKAAASTPNMPLDKLFPQDWVLAIPNYYTDAQRRAVLAGCESVGITGVQRLMHENTATALAYGIFKDLKKEFDSEKPTNVMFIDIGASACTVSIASFVPGKLIVKSAYCDPDLGGRDFDLAIANWLAEEFEKKFAGKLSGKPMEKAKPRLKLLAAAEKAKKTLSPQGVKEARINLEMLMDDFDFSVALKAHDYEAMCQPLLARLEAPIRLALTEAALQATDLASVEIVGGTTRIGCVKRKLQEILGCSLSTTMNADEAVARGAALQSAILSPRFKVLPYEIQEAQPYPIKISWEDDSKASGVEVDTAGGDSPTDSVIMFDRGLSFPVVRRVTLSRSGDFVVRCSYDESAVQFGLGTTREIAEITINAPPGDEKKVRVNVKEDIHGILQMSSAQMVEEIEEPAEEGAAENKDAAEGKEGEANDETAEKKKKKIKKTNLTFRVRRPLEMTQDEINKAHEAEVHMANNDRIVKETADKRNELESYIYDMRDKVSMESQLGPYGTEAEKAAFLKANEAMENWLYEDGFDATKSVYVEKLAELKKLGQPMELRQQEAQGRAAALSTLQANLETFQKWVNESQWEQRYDHITDEEREKARETTDRISAWMYEMLDKQGALAQNQDPVLTVADLKTKNLELNNTVSPIMNKKVPPKKKETPPPADASKDESKDGDKPMDVDEEAKAEDEAKPMDVEGEKASEGEDPSKMDTS